MHLKNIYEILKVYYQLLCSKDFIINFIINFGDNLFLIRPKSNVGNFAQNKAPLSLKIFPHLKSLKDTVIVSSNHRREP